MFGNGFPFRSVAMTVRSVVNVDDNSNGSVEETISREAQTLVSTPASMLKSVPHPATLVQSVVTWITSSPG